MIERLLDKLEPQRRHLSYLVGLLVLTFVLTGVLAFQAHRTQAARAADSTEWLGNSVDSYHQKWALAIEQLVGNALLRSVPARSHMELPTIPLAGFAALARLARTCPMCEPNLAAEGYFAMGPAAGDIEVLGRSLSAATVERVRGYVAAGRFTAISDSVHGAVYFVDDGGTPRVVVAYVVQDDRGGVQRVLGIVTDTVSPRSILNVALATTAEFHEAYVGMSSNDEMFVIGARVADVPIRVPDEPGVMASEKTLDAEIVSGPALRVALRKAAHADLARGAGTAALLLALVALIGVVLALALLLVRREAELVRLRADFISGVSHELRTPLAQIRMFTETLLLGRTRSDIERRRSLEIIDQEARRLTHLVENVLLFSRGEGGRQAGIAPEPTVFAAEVRRAVESFGPMCRSRSADIRAELQENITASVDRNALRQILVNLLENALKYGPDGQRITVGLALYDSAARIWVDDEGPGIPAADRERVFDSFVRLRRDLEARVTGSGIGLSVVRELARLHDGEVRAESAPGGGARIVVEFPGAYLRAETPSEMSAAS